MYIYQPEISLKGEQSDKQHTYCIMVTPFFGGYLSLYGGVNCLKNGSKR